VGGCAFGNGAEHGLDRRPEMVQRHRVHLARLGSLGGLPRTHLAARRDGNRPDRAGRRVLLGGCRSLRPQTSGPRARGVRLSRGVPCARDRSSGRTLCRRRVLRCPAWLSQEDRVQNGGLRLPAERARVGRVYPGPGGGYMPIPASASATLPIALVSVGCVVSKALTASRSCSMIDSGSVPRFCLRSSRSSMSPSTLRSSSPQRWRLG